MTSLWSAAGPAGSTTAYRLARAHARVLLVDKDAVPARQALRRRADDARGPAAAVLGRARRGGPDHPRALPAPVRPRDGAVVGARALPDDAAHGGSTRSSCSRRPRPAPTFRDGVRVEVESDRERPRRRRARRASTRVIGADGANGTTAKSARPRRRDRQRRRARRATCRTSVCRRTTGAACSCSSSRRFPAATAGSFRRATTSTSASAAGGPKARGCASTSRVLCERYGIDARRAEQPARPPPADAPVRRRCSRAGARSLVGDAAGVIDPVSGDGMYEGFVTATPRRGAHPRRRASTRYAARRAPRARRALVGRLGREEGPRPLPARRLRDHAAARHLAGAREARCSARSLIPGRRSGAGRTAMKLIEGLAQRRLKRPTRTCRCTVSAMELNPLLRRAVELGASDIHLKVGVPPILRRDGSLGPLEEAPDRSTDSDVGSRARSRRQALAGALRGLPRRPATSTSRTRTSDLPRFRVNAFRQRGHISFAFRVIPKNVPNFEHARACRPACAASPRSTAASCSSPARPAPERRRRSPR